MTKTRHEAYLRRMHRGIIAERMKQLGFTLLSQYVLSLIRYDRAGRRPAQASRRPDSKPMIAALDAKTHVTFHTQPPRKWMGSL